MSRKSTEAYHAVFKYIEDEIYQLKPAQFMTDFEAGMRKAIVFTYPHAILFGCWYHYCAAIRRKVLGLNLYRLIVDSVSAKSIYRKMLSLPLLPSELIQEGYELIKQEAYDKKLYKEFKKVFLYFENFWLHLVCSLTFFHVLSNKRKLY